MQVQVPYNQAIDRKYPAELVVVIAKDAQGKYNPCTLGWAMRTSIDPPMFAISLGHTRYTLEAIRLSKQFVLALPASHQQKETMLFGTRSGRDGDKLAQAGAATQPARMIDGVLLAEAVANFECLLTGEMTTGDHVILAGQVVCSHVSDDPDARRLYIAGPGHQLGAVRAD